MHWERPVREMRAAQPGMLLRDWQSDTRQAESF